MRSFPVDARPFDVLPEAIDVNGDGNLVKRVVSPGNALVGKPPPTAMCKVHYECWLMNGVRIENTRENFGHPYVKLGAKMELALLEQVRYAPAPFVCSFRPVTWT